MRAREALSLGIGAVRSKPLRSGLSALGIAVGVAAVILLTSIGHGLHRYVLDEFTQFGTNVLTVVPGTTETVGIPGVLGGSTKKLTIDDAVAVARLASVLEAVPVAYGLARVSAGPRGRSVYVYGVTDRMPDVWRFSVRQGSFLPPVDPHRAGPWAVLGPKLARELFVDRSPLGEHVRIGGARFRVVGVMEPKGQILGFDLDDAAYVPVASAMQVFDLEQLQEIDVSYDPRLPPERVEEEVRALLADRHGDEDFTIITQAAMIAVLDRVLGVVTFAVGAIAGVSLLVGAVGILTTMWIAVGERTGEIGLVRAIGARRGQVLGIFLGEAALLAGLGGAAGLAGGLLLARGLAALLPGLPVRTPVEFVLAGLATSILTGLAAGVGPARRAARLDPIDALKAE